MLKKIMYLKIESLLLFVLSIVMTIVLKAEINFYYYVLLFFLVDIVGYVPGRIFNYFKGDEVTHKAFYIIYNSFHNLVTITLVSLLWFYYFKDFSFLALYLHLFLDRGILGNFLKSSTDTYKTPTTQLRS